MKTNWVAHCTGWRCEYRVPRVPKWQNIVKTNCVLGRTTTKPQHQFPPLLCSPVKKIAIILECFCRHMPRTQIRNVHILQHTSPHQPCTKAEHVSIPRKTAATAANVHLQGVAQERKRARFLEIECAQLNTSDIRSRYRSTPAYGVGTHKK